MCWEISTRASVAVDLSLNVITIDGAGRCRNPEKMLPLQLVKLIKPASLTVCPSYL